jgi:large subunit ribosomal protein L4e
MKAKIFNIDGKTEKEIELPEFFSLPVREDIVEKVLEAKKTFQPYAPSLVGGKQHSASGILRHKRHSWKSSRGRGRSRVPRKILWRRGTQFNWVGAEISSTVGGRRAHPPKVISQKNTNSINKKEAKMAFLSALSATANKDFLKKKYESLNDNQIESMGDLPFIVDNKIITLKTKERLESLKNILKDLFSIAIKKKTVRAGKGKRRGRKYKSNAGALIVVGKGEKMRVSGVDIKKANVVSVTDLAKGGVGRLTIYTENAIRDLSDRLNGGNGKK